MNTRSRYPESSVSPISEEKIDRALRSLGAVQPRPGIEGRIAARLAHAAHPRPSRLAGWSRLMMASAGGVVACAVIVAGSVNHSHRLLPAQPGLPVPGNASAGVGAADAAKVAPKLILAPHNGRARSVRNQHKTGRASVSPDAPNTAAPNADAPKPEGVGLPKSPVPQR